MWEWIDKVRHRDESAKRRLTIILATTFTLFIVFVWAIFEKVGWGTYTKLKSPVNPIGEESGENWARFKEGSQKSLELLGGMKDAFGALVPGENFAPEDEK